MTDSSDLNPPVPPERARIEPPTATHKLDALPILYLLGFIILAASLVYVWRHPGGTGGEVREAQRVDTLRQDADARRRELAELSGKVAALEARKPVDLSPLEARLAALENRKPVDLTPLERRATELGSRIDALDSGTAAKLAALDAATKANAANLAGIAEKAQRARRVASAATALESGQRLGDIPGAPPAIARFAHDNPPTESSLRLSFDAAADAAHRASQPAITEDKPLLDRMWTRAQQSVTVRQGDRVLVGDPIAGVLASARQALDAGDLQGAVKALGGLAGPAKAAMADWIGRAQSLLDARASLAEMAAG